MVVRYGKGRLCGVFDEVGRSDVPAGTKVVPTRLLFAIKSDGTFEVSIVMRGDLMTEGEHYVKTKSFMVSLEATRMVVALAAGNGMHLFSMDSSQAFRNADIDVADLYCSELELELIQSHMTQKPVLRGEVDTLLLPT